MKGNGYFADLERYSLIPSLGFLPILCVLGWMICDFKGAVNLVLAFLAKFCDSDPNLNLHVRRNSIYIPYGLLRYLGYSFRGRARPALAFRISFMY